MMNTPTGKKVLEYHVNRKLWDKAIELLDKPPKTRRLMCTAPNGSRGPRKDCPTTSFSVLGQIRQAMLRHDWILVRRLLTCFMRFHRQSRNVVNKVLFQTLLSSPASTHKIIQEFCRMYLGVGSEEEINIFLKTISKVPRSIPSGRTRLTADGRLNVSTGSGNTRACAYTEAACDVIEDCR